MRINKCYNEMGCLNLRSYTSKDFHEARSVWGKAAGVGHKRDAVADTAVFQEFNIAHF